jgi:hypothetical protein
MIRLLVLSTPKLKPKSIAVGVDPAGEKSSPAAALQLAMQVSKPINQLRH